MPLHIVVEMTGSWCTTGYFANARVATASVVATAWRGPNIQQDRQSGATGGVLVSWASIYGLHNGSYS